MKEECNQLFIHCFFSTPRVQSKLKKDKDRCSPHCQNYCIFPNKDGAMFRELPSVNISRVTGSLVSLRILLHHHCSARFTANAL